MSWQTHNCKNIPLTLSLKIGEGSFHLIYYHIYYIIVNNKKFVKWGIIMGGIDDLKDIKLGDIDLGNVDGCKRKFSKLFLW